MAAPPPVLSVQGLTIHFAADRGVVRAIEDVSFAVNAGETVALVGESGSGKSVTGLAILGLLPATGQIVGGQIIFRGRDGAPVDLAAASERTPRAARGAGV